MDEFFTQEEPQLDLQSPADPQEYAAPELGLASHIVTNQAEVNPVQFGDLAFEEQPNYNQPENDNDFNDFQEDEVTRMIRQEQLKVQNELKLKSDQEWEEKQKRQTEGRAQLEQFRDSKQEENRTRAADNIRKEKELREEQGKLNTQEGWRKVISNINIKQGEHKGTKDVNRMREAILHKREDYA